MPHGFHAFDPHSWVIKQTPSGVRLWVSLDELAISRAILVDAYEPAETRFIAAHLHPGDVAVDAGANVGFHALHMAKIAGPAGRVIAFEPLTYLADALEAGVRENGFEDRMEVRRTALSDGARRARLRHAPRTANFGGAHLAPADEPAGFQRDDTVPCVRLDDAVGERRIAFLKIDVEGAEPRVITGAAALLARDRPVIMAELHDPQLRRVSGKSATDFIAQLAALGYVCRTIGEDGAPGPELRAFAQTDPVNVAFFPA